MARAIVRRYAEMADERQDRAEEPRGDHHHHEAEPVAREVRRPRERGHHERRDGVAHCHEEREHLQLARAAALAATEVAAAA